MATHVKVSDVDDRSECTETGGSFQESYQNLVQTSLLFRYTLQKITRFCISESFNFLM